MYVQYHQHNLKPSKMTTWSHVRLLTIKHVVVKTIINYRRERRGSLVSLTTIAHDFYLKKICIMLLFTFLKTSWHFFYFLRYSLQLGHFLLRCKLCLKFVNNYFVQINRYHSILDCFIMYQEWETSKIQFTTSLKNRIYFKYCHIQYHFDRKNLNNPIKTIS